MNSPDVWQIEVNERIYDASFEEVIEWINEGAILPEDKIRRGNLRWIGAGKVPELYEYFQAANFREESSNSVVTSNSRSNEVYTNFQVENFKKSTDQNNDLTQVSVNNLPQTINSSNFAKEVSIEENGLLEIIACSVHPELDPIYICEICNVLFCKTCPHSFGSSVKLCLECGGLCIPYVGQDRSAEKRIHGAVNKPYKRIEKTEDQIDKNESSLKMEDLLNALKYPLNFPASFLIGSTSLILLLFGLSLTAFGGIAMLFTAAGFGLMTVMLTFCVLAKIVENFSQRKFTGNFLPKLNKYNIWEDVIHPSFLSIGVYLAAFGLFFAITISAGFYTWYKYSNEMESVESQMRQTDSRMNTIVKNARSNIETSYQNQILQTPADGNNTADLEQMIEQTKEESFESIFGTNHLGDNQEIEKFAKSFVRISVPFQMPMLFAFIVGLFYFPAAASIAGSTRSLGKTVNPFTALKIIKSFGLDYFKILFLSSVFVFITFSAAAVCYFLFSDFSLKLVGILSAITIGSVLSFYFWTVFSYFLGMAVYNKSENIVSEHAPA